jgi:hypothetical protein
VTIRVAAFTPIHARWPYPLREITRGIRVVEKPVFDEQNWDFWNLRRTEIRDALERSHWLCIESECEYQNRDSVLTKMQTDLRNAMLGFQLWAPIGWDGIIILAESSDGAVWRVDSVSIPEAYPRSQWGRMIAIEKLNPDELGPLVEGTLLAFESKSVPLMNPFQFLEIGLQTASNHVIAGALFWTIGLDGLLGAAGGQDLFAKRLARLLGADTRILPECWAGRLPVYTVGEMAKDIFGLRNQLSHGSEILEKYRKPISFKFELPELAYLAIEKWTQTTLIVESALFVLLAALRKVITAGYMERMKDQRLWSRWLDSPP